MNCRVQRYDVTRSARSIIYLMILDIPVIGETYWHPSIEARAEQERTIANQRTLLLNQDPIIAFCQ